MFCLAPCIGCSVATRDCSQKNNRAENRSHLSIHLFKDYRGLELRKKSNMSKEKSGKDVKMAENMDKVKT